MLTRRVVASAVLWAVLLVSGERLVFADGFRCPITDRLIETGDSTAKVMQDCGAPKSRTDVLGAACFSKTGRCPRVKTGERWVYDFGSNYLVLYLLFKNDLLAIIETGMYGDAH